MDKVRKAFAVLTVVAAAAAFSPAAMAKGGGGLPGGGGDLGGGGISGGGGGSTTPIPGINITGTWSGTETVGILGTNPAVLSVIENSPTNFSGSYTRIVAGDSPVFKITSGSVSGNVVSLRFSQGGKASLHPDVMLSGTLSADGNTITGIFGVTPVVLTR